MVLSLFPEKDANIKNSQKVSKNFLGKGETDVKANKTAFAVLLQNSSSFDVVRMTGVEPARSRPH